METTLGRWLREREEAPSAYAIRRGFSYGAVARLVGLSRKPYAIARPDYAFLTKIAGDTGIPIGTLIEDAIRASTNPRPPRRYTRKVQAAE
jgi:transcriptional regulator with XRE-family HTH domain